MEKTRQTGGFRRPIFEILYCVIAFVCFFVMYHVPLPFLKDSYGLFAGSVEPESVTGWESLISTGYIRLVDELYFYLGEKFSVIRGLHIVGGFFSFLFLFLGVRKFRRPLATYGIPTVFVAVFAALGIGLSYDAWIVPAFALCALLYLLLTVFAVVLRPGSGRESSHVVESLAERERRESQAPKTIVNDKGETITLLANPLPGPKKHVKRVLDYDVDVPPEMLCYDTPVAVTDDFDIP